MKKNLFFLSFWLIPFSLFSQISDSAVTELQTATITHFMVNDSLLNVPVSISILDEKTIQSNNSTEISWVLNKAPGVFMQSGSINTNRISIRGLGARTPYGTNRIRGFYGNIPLTSGDSETTIEDLDLEQISQIEIIKGPMSSIYGAGLGGAILLHPKKSKFKGSEFRFSTTVGSFELLKNNAGYSWNSDHSSIHYGYSRIQSDGFRENSGYFREGHTISGDAYRNEKHRLSYLFNQTYLKSFIASSINENDFEENPSSAAANWRVAQGYEQYTNWMGGLDYAYQISPKTELAATVYFATKEGYEPRPFDILTQNTQTYGGRIQLSGSSIFNLPFQYVLGGELFQDEYDGKTFENLYETNDGNGSLQGNQLTQTLQDRFFYNLFAQIRIPIYKKWEIQAGLNFNQTQFDLTNAFPQEDFDQFKHAYDPIFSPQVSLLFHPNKNQTFFASYSRGYSYPSIDEMLNEEGRVNTSIRPETGNNLEIGYKLFSPKFHLEISAYRMNVKDLLVSERVAEDQYIGVNAGKTLHQGIEISSHYKFVLHRNWIFTPSVSASIGQYEFEEFKHNGNDYSGNELTGVPANLVTAGFELRMPYGFRWLADYYFVDEFPINDANSVYNQSYQLVNTKLDWEKEFWNQLKVGLSVGVNNLTDTHYASMVLVNATAFGNALPRYYYPGNPVNFYGQLRLSVKL